MSYNADAKEYDEETTITLANNAAALVVSPDDFTIYLPKMDDEDEVPTYIVILTGISILMANEDFVKKVLDSAYSALEAVEE